MKNLKLSFPVIIIILSLIVSACDFGKDDEDKNNCIYPLNNKSIALNTTNNESIVADSVQGYTFTTTTAGPYTISATFLTTNVDWYLYEYKSECYEGYDTAIEISFSTQSGVADETKTVSLAASTKYQIVIEEWNNTNGTYTLQVSH